MKRKKLFVILPLVLVLAAVLGGLLWAAQWEEKEEPLNLISLHQIEPEKIEWISIFDYETGRNRVFKKQEKMDEILSFLRNVPLSEIWEPTPDPEGEEVSPGEVRYMIKVEEYAKGARGIAVYGETEISAGGGRRAVCALDEAELKRVFELEDVLELLEVRNSKVEWVSIMDCETGEVKVLPEASMDPEMRAGLHYLARLHLRHTKNAEVDPENAEEKASFEIAIKEWEKEEKKITVYGKNRIVWEDEGEAACTLDFEELRKAFCLEKK